MYILLVVLGLLVQESLLLRMVRVSVPAYRVRGQQAVLECHYELGRDGLYSVKWYRESEEFYRYMPKFDPPKHAYKIDGIKVDLSKSDDRQVVLHQVTLKSSGVYRCEVSGEAPGFASAAGEGRMEVIYLPREGPRISGNELENKRGESLFLNCTSGRSYPAAVLSWDIDGEKVTNPSMLVEYPIIQHSHGLLSTALGLHVPIGRTMQVRCLARVAPAWREGSEAIVGNSQIADSKEALLLVDGHSRAARLRLANESEVVRPIQRLYALELRADESAAAHAQAGAGGLRSSGDSPTLNVVLLAFSLGLSHFVIKIQSTT